MFSNSSGGGLGATLMNLFRTKKPKQQLKEIRMCVLGLDNSGKTTILKSLSREEIQYVMPT